MKDPDLQRDLEAIFGHVIADVTPHAGDRTENPPRTPAFVVEAQAPEQVGKLLELASRRGVPVTPKVAGLNIGGLAIPAEGGIVLDLRRLKDVEIDPVHMVAWIGPGVTWEQLKAEADRHDLVLAFPLAPPDTSVLACALMDGLSTMALSHGSYADWITGVEAYLADGTKLLTGSAAVSGRPLSRGPLPDLTGLFVNWFGSTGVVTRLGLCLWPKRRYRRRDVVACRDIESGAALMRTAARTGLYHDLAGIGWPAAKWALGLDTLGPRDPEEPELYVIAEYDADDADEFRLKARRLKALAPAPPLAVNDLTALVPDLKPFAELPARLPFLLDHEGGGLSWVGTYGPVDRLAEGARAGIALMEQAGHPPLVVCRPMKGGHFAVLRFIERFDRRDAAATARVRDLNVKLARMALDLGYVPYKCPEVLLDEVLGRMDPGFRATMLRVKNALDPAAILNPDRWRFR